MLKIKNLFFKVKAVDQESYSIRGVFSTGSEDRHGEVVVQSGWNLAEFMLNPVVLYQHDPSVPVIGKVTDIGLNQEQNLEGTIKFAAEENPFAMVIYKLYAGGFMRAFSAGFRNDEYSVNQDTGVINLLKNTLFEVSCVAIPANHLALAKQKGIDTTVVEAYQIRKQEIASRCKEEDEWKPEPIQEEEPKKEETKEPAPVEEPKKETPAEEPKSAGIDTLRSAEKMLKELISSAERGNTDTKGAASQRSLPLSQGGRRVNKALLNKVIRKLHESKHIV